MKNKYRNWFLAFGIFSVAVMLLAMDMDYTDIRGCLKRVGMWFPAVVVLWFFIYLMNTASWYLIINNDKKEPISFLKVYKLSVTGYALNYTTPCGLMGGEPYRIMELTPYVGASKATSSVILYVMMHIFSHFWFWFLSVFLYLVLYPVNPAMGVMLVLVCALCLTGIYFFSRGYRTGMTVKGLKLLAKLPFIRKWARRFLDEKRETLQQIDNQIAMLHRQHKRTFYASLILEYLARIVSSLELYFILRAFSTDVSMADCVLILAFSSLFSNLLFFSPMQMGTREGGLAIAVNGLQMSGVLGVYTGLITRLRELIWIAIGILLIKVGNSSVKLKQEECKS